MISTRVTNPRTVSLTAEGGGAYKGRSKATTTAPCQRRHRQSRGAIRLRFAKSAAMPGGIRQCRRHCRIGKADWLHGGVTLTDGRKRAIALIACLIVV